MEGFLLETAERIFGIVYRPDKIINKSMSENNFTVDRDKLEVIQSRVFNVPREKVYKNFTDSEAIPKWWGPRMYSTIVEKNEVKVGGGWRFVQIDKDGNFYAFHGEYKEIVPPGKIVETFNFEGTPGNHESIETLTLEDLGNSQTRMTTVSKFANLQDLDGSVNAGMEKGAEESWDRLGELLAK